MAWFKVDDTFGSNPKVMQIPRSERALCLGVWLQAGVWSAQHLTDGFVPDYMLDELGADVSQRDRLLGVGLWVAEAGGVRFKDWAQYQPMKSDVMAKREKERVRKEAYRDKIAGNKGQSPAGTGSDGDAGQQRVSAHPDPTRPDPARPLTTTPNGVVESAPKKGTRIDTKWMPDPEVIEHMKTECPDIDLGNEHKKFIDHWIAQPGQKGIKKDWNATWRNWIRRSRDFKPAGKKSNIDGWQELAASYREEDAHERGTDSNALGVYQPS